MTHPLIDQGVMLATASKELAPKALLALEIAQGAGFHFEIKWDGVRCLAHLDQGQVWLRNRRGVDITERYPEVATALQEAFPDETYTLDGEIVAFDEEGLPSFDILSRRDRLIKPDRIKAAMRTIPACFIAFDVLMDRGHDLRQAPYVGRRVVLDGISKELSASSHLRIGPSTENGPSLWQFVDERDMEGLIAKAPHSVYHAGRSPGWVKLKRSSTSSFVVTGYEEGSGRAEGMVGALFIASWDPAISMLVERGKVGTGFTQKMRKSLALQLDAPPYTNPDPLIVEVEYASITKDGSLRFPSFQGIRNDLTIQDCTLERP